ncbi:helix-turn-helix domain-containing protein [Desulfobacca acetoxidans]|uniref:Helix-turn-helix domain protein n=1 Tax=Desulfobacca acetoxidans (strain ATCC 700848 / DSM 11109 / ASRB2) TaxID=880072 RepID=F2NFG5_DESAR|nr:helix-turn-helix transcriptional regulator [Desulfobacca acetoxidans]AEB10084.1 helix-turn-helix domain protein [Desulfobacca acetoxidans DSM 11109]HAY20978.1 XRE family transcriptional regulator [Desulfobacterales bacterium]
MNLLDEYMQDKDFKKLMAQEDLIMEVTETLCYLLEQEGVTRQELAKRLNKSKGFISQLLNGGRNLTLRTIADIAESLGYRVTIGAEKKFDLQNVKFLKFPTKEWGFKIPCFTEDGYRIPDEVAA